jgi:membrane protease YdiL (CAAX protease family)
MSKDSSKTGTSDSQIEKVPWSAWLAVIFVIIVYYTSQIISGSLVSIYPLLKGWTHNQTLDWLNNNVIAQFGYILVAEALVVAALYAFLKMYRCGFKSIGLKRPRWIDPLYGLAALPLYFALYLLSVGAVSYFVSGFNINQQQEVGFNNVQGGFELALTFVGLVLLPAFAEEVMVRGFLYSSLKKALRPAAAVIGTSAIFSAAHLPEGGAAGPLYIAALDTFVLSLVLIWLREKTGSLWASITLHALKNALAFIALFALHLR